MPLNQPRKPDGRFDQTAAESATPPGVDSLDDLSAFLPAGTVQAWRMLSDLIPDSAYLSGGTALTVHLRHRLSRDLDFFTEEPFSVETLARTLDSAGDFVPTMTDEGTLNGLFDDTKVQFLDASSHRILAPMKTVAGIRVASLSDITANKLKVIQDRGELRDYFDLMCIDEYIPMEDGINLLIEKYTPLSPTSVIANVVRGLGYLDDVEDDPSLPLERSRIEDFWARRQRELSLRLGLA